VGIICKDPVHSKTRVAIVGGGIEGLAAALALDMCVCVCVCVCVCIFSQGKK
jgi:aspartate oxidase